MSTFMIILFQQLMQQLNSPPPLTSDPVRIVEEFPRWLERISSRTPGGAIVVIDSIDRFQVSCFKKCFSGHLFVYMI